MKIRNLNTKVIMIDELNLELKIRFIVSLIKLKKIYISNNKLNKKKIFKGKFF